MKQLLITLLIATTSLFGYHMGDINTNGEDLEASVMATNRLSRVTTQTVAIGGMMIEDEYKKKQNLFYLDYYLTGRASRYYGLSLGMQAHYASPKINGKTKDLIAFPLQAKAHLYYPLGAMKIKGAISYAYAPSVLVFTSDFEDSKTLDVEIGLEIIKGGIIYVGTRQMSLKDELTGRDYELNNANYIGVRFLF